MTQAQQIDELLRDVLTRSSDGLNYDDAAQGIAFAITALRKQTEALSRKNYGRMDGALVARCVGHTAKAADELYRLVQFAKGAPDSRPDAGGDWLRGLTAPQLAQVQRWVEENARVAEGR